MINVLYNFTTKSLAAHLDTNGHTRAHGAHPAYRKEGTNGHTAHIPHTATRRTLPVTSRGRPTRAYSAQHARPHPATSSQPRHSALGHGRCARECRGWHEELRRRARLHERLAKALDKARGLHLREEAIER